MVDTYVSNCQHCQFLENPVVLVKHFGSHFVGCKVSTKHFRLHPLSAPVSEQNVHKTAMKQMRFIENQEELLGIGKTATLSSLPH